MANKYPLVLTGTTVEEIQSTDVIPVDAGGTGTTSLTANNVLLGNGTSALQVVAPGSSGNILTSNGTTWVSSTPSSGGVTTFSAGTTGFTPSTGTSGAVTLAGTLAATNGGTGQATYAVGDLLYASTTTALSKLSDVATGNVLISGGVAVAPSWGKVGLTTHISGTLPIANGGTGLTAVGSSGTVLTSNGSSASWAALASASLLRQTVFTSSGTWSKGANTKYVLVQAVGGGGGGGGAAASYQVGGGGGGAGGFSQKFIDVSAISTVTVTVGSGGTGVNDSTGNAGGTTSFGSHLSCNGGSGGDGGGTANNGGAGGTASSGDLNITGGGGACGAGGLYRSGIGGASYFGGSGVSRYAYNAAGADGNAYGSGGSGSSQTSGSYPGGNGKAGVVIVQEFA